MHGAAPSSVNPRVKDTRSRPGPGARRRNRSRPGPGAEAGPAQEPGRCGLRGFPDGPAAARRRRAVRSPALQLAASAARRRSRGRLRTRLGGGLLGRAEADAHDGIARVLHRGGHAQQARCPPGADVVAAAAAYPADGSRESPLPGMA